MGVSGDLKTMLPGDLLQWLSLGQKTGTLTVSNRAVEKRIYFRGGRVISSASNDSREYLGQFLVSHGFLDETELMKAMEVQQQSGILLGKILVMIDAISEEDLLRLMRLKAEEEIYEIFLWPNGSFRFVDDNLPAQEMIPLQIDVTGIIMEGSRRVDEWTRIRELIPDDDAIPVVVKPIDPRDIDSAQAAIVAAVDGMRSIACIALESRSTRFVVSSTLHSLMRRGYLRLVERASGSRHAVLADDGEELAALLGWALDALKSRQYEKAQQLLKTAETLDPNHPEVRAAIRSAEEAIMEDLQGQGLHPSSIPRVSKSLDEITQMDFTPNEGFILSRVNGQSDIDSLLEVSPMKEPDALLILYKLWREGIIAVE